MTELRDWKPKVGELVELRDSVDFDGRHRHLFESYRFQFRVVKVTPQPGKASLIHVTYPWVWPRYCDFDAKWFKPAPKQVFAPLRLRYYVACCVRPIGALLRWLADAVDPWGAKR
ncbi:MAG TPA: hypothetical protein VMY37_40130 [Thermoguttaceae bacterium]|nr:hypothetical protein [Thermoguttaceae bacterium]